VLNDALVRMENGGVRQASDIAERAEPVVRDLEPAIDRFLARPAGADDAASVAAEDGLEEILTELQLLLNDLDEDPSKLLAARLEAVTATERTVRRTALVLIPLGLACVAACGWLLRSTGGAPRPRCATRSTSRHGKLGPTS
jgi:hypothetical protein